MVWFSWRAESKPELRILNDQYVLQVHYWTKHQGLPLCEEHKFHVDARAYAELDGYRARHDSAIVNLGLDREIAENRVLTSYESKTLLGA